jgi:hypothetical protein
LADGANASTAVVRIAAESSGLNIVVCILVIGLKRTPVGKWHGSLVWSRSQND